MQPLKSALGKKGGCGGRGYGRERENIQGIQGRGRGGGGGADVWLVQLKATDHSRVAATKIGGYEAVANG